MQIDEPGLQAQIERMQHLYIVGPIYLVGSHGQEPTLQSQVQSVQSGSDRLT